MPVVRGCLRTRGLPTFIICWPRGTPLNMPAVEMKLLSNLLPVSATPRRKLHPPGHSTCPCPISGQRQRVCLEFCAAPNALSSSARIALSPSRRRQRRAPLRLIVLRRLAEDAPEHGRERARAGVAQRVGNRADAVAVGQPAEGVGQMHLLPPLAVVQAGLLRE